MSEIKRYAVVIATVVDNVIDADETYVHPNPDAVLVEDVDHVAARGLVYADGVFTVASIIIDRDAMAAEIDAVAVSIYEPKIALSKEYENREAQARAHLADSNVAAPRVQAFATAEGITLAQACAVVVGQADALYAALDQISDLRMQKRSLLRKNSEQQYVLNDAGCIALHTQVITSLNAIKRAVA